VTVNVSRRAAAARPCPGSSTATASGGPPARGAPPWAARASTAPTQSTSRQSSCGGSQLCRKTYYLDTCTLSYAFRAANGAADKVPPGFSTVAAWIESIAQSGNLCVSFVHAAEFSDWPDVVLADELAKWLDSLPIVWPVADQRELELLEGEYFAKRVLGVISPDVPFRPYVPREDYSMSGLVRVARNSGRWSGVKQLGVVQTEKLRTNRAQRRAAGVTKKEMARHSRDTKSRILRDNALAVHDRLLARGDPDYQRVQIGRDLQVKFVELFDRDAKSFPTLRMDWAQIEDLDKNAAVRTPGSGTDTDQLEGVIGDRLHGVLGGSYCDVFTCDRYTRPWVALVRRQLGLPPPFVLGKYPGGPLGFVGDLTAC
jgi:hypothetical protein